MDQELATDLIMQSLSYNYIQAIMNYSVNETGKPLTELLSILRTAKQSMNKGKAVMMIQGLMAKESNKEIWRQGKGHRSGWGRMLSLCSKTLVLSTWNLRVEWLRMAHAFIVVKLDTGRAVQNTRKSSKKMKNEIFISCIFVIEVNFSPSLSWVLDIGCWSHICTNVQDLKGVDHWQRVKLTYTSQMAQELLL